MSKTALERLISNSIPGIRYQGAQLDDFEIESVSNFVMQEPETTTPFSVDISIESEFVVSLMDRLSQGRIEIMRGSWKTSFGIIDYFRPKDKELLFQFDQNFLRLMYALG